MKDGAIIIAIEAELKEISTGQGCFLCEQFEDKHARRGKESDFGSGLRFKVVVRTHDGRFYSIIW